MNIGTYYGGWSYSTIASISKESPKDWDLYHGWEQKIFDWTYAARYNQGSSGYLSCIYNGNKYYILGNVLAYEKATGAWVDLVEKGLNKGIVFPGKDNVYKGKAWEVWKDVVKWFDVENLTAGTVQLPTESFGYTSEIRNISQGVILRTILSPYDGKKYLLTIDIETGAYQTTEAENAAKVINLVPLN